MSSRSRIRLKIPMDNMQPEELIGKMIDCKRNMSADRGRATWDVSCTEIFIQECIEQIYKTQRKGSSFTKEGWNNILAGFNEKAGKSYDNKQLKNKFGSLKKEWKAWDKLFSKETDIVFDYARNMVIAEDKWWERKTKENLAYAKYRYNGMKFVKELQILFKDVMTLREKMFTPSSTQQMSLGDDVYRPTMDLEESLGDNEEELQRTNMGGSVQVPIDLKGITLTTNTQCSAPSGLRNIGKRKRGEGSDASKEEKIPPLKQIADALSMIAITSKDRADALKKIYNNDKVILEGTKKELSRKQKKSLLISLIDEEITEYKQVGVLMAQYMMHYACKKSCRTSKQT
ncbi:hypothetical protein QN277_028660 [Acacia crassicarpa]|uniref:Myb/SANT-like domain-containing protein n=1 Tax=Acacia crassicarpa TaxID=499986 RepID=A0AAE1MFE1_9FABA|nr:hypothetical protein QN277_028660 [Acacia crassicarpa]